MKKYICTIGLLTGFILSTAQANTQQSYDGLGDQVAEMGCMVIHDYHEEWGKPRTLGADLRQADIGNTGIYYFEHGDRAIYQWEKEPFLTNSPSHLDGAGVCYKYNKQMTELECEYRIGYSFDRINQYGEYMFKFVPLSRLCHINPDNSGR